MSEPTEDTVSQRLKRYAAVSFGSFRDRSRMRNKHRRSLSASRTNHSRLNLASKSQVADGIEGFEELRHIIKRGGDISKEIAAVIAERAALELQYAKGLQKLSGRLTKTCTNVHGTTAAAWETVAEEMNAESETHKKIGESLMEDICKPLRNMCDNHTKVKKPVEMAVEKATRVLVQARTNELKHKCKSFHTSGETEKVHASIIERRRTSKKTPDKELAKLEKKLILFKDQMRKSSKKYYSSSLKSERCREEWETTSIKSMSQLQQLEEERLKELHKYLKLYKYALENSVPQLTTSCRRVDEAATCIDFDQDLRKVIETRTKAESQPEQILLDTFPGDTNQLMDSERRRQALTLFLYYLRQDIEQEQKTVSGVQKLVDAYSSQPEYADREALEDTRLQSRQIHAMLNFLDASHYKLSHTLSSLNDQHSPEYKFSVHMESTHDKMGLPLTYLRVPVSQIADGFNHADFSARGHADGSQSINGSTYEPLSQDGDDYYSDNDIDDEFDHYDYPDRATGSRDHGSGSQKVVCKCRVLYDFNSTQSNELTVREGDEVNILEKHSDGWWRAELRGAIGLIPESYVESL